MQIFRQKDFPTAKKLGRAIVPPPSSAMTPLNTATLCEGKSHCK